MHGYLSHPSTLHIRASGVAIPEPRPVNAIPVATNLSAYGVAKFSNFKYPTSGLDYKGEQAGPGAVTQTMIDQLNIIIDAVQQNGSVKEINLNLTFSASPYSTMSAVELSAKNGVENVKSYLQNNGLGNTKINTSSRVVEESKEGNVNKLDVNYK